MQSGKEAAEARPAQHAFEDAGGASVDHDAAKVGGAEAVEIIGKDEDGVTHAWVATEGKHYIVKISNAGDEGGEIAFSDFDEPVGAKKPAAGDVLDFSKLG